MNKPNFNRIKNQIYRIKENAPLPQSMFVELLEMHLALKIAWFEYEKFLSVPKYSRFSNYRSDEIFQRNYNYALKLHRQDIIEFTNQLKEYGIKGLKSR